MKKGDTIKCHDADDAAEYMSALCKAGFKANFVYQMDGAPGIWIVIEEEPDGTTDA